MRTSGGEKHLTIATHALMPNLRKWRKIRLTDTSNRGRCLTPQGVQKRKERVTES
jgi:hypothetical protein